jgi:hypothetical protein
VKGLLAFGMNGVAIGPNSQKNIDALKKAEWLVVCDIYPEETGDFWRSPGVATDEMKSTRTELTACPAPDPNLQQPAERPASEHGPKSRRAGAVVRAVEVSQNAWRSYKTGVR